MTLFHKVPKRNIKLYIKYKTVMNLTPLTPVDILLNNYYLFLASLEKLEVALTLVQTKQAAFTVEVKAAIKEAVVFLAEQNTAVLKCIEEKKD